MSVSGILLINAIMLGTSFLLPNYLQDALLCESMAAGFMLLPSAGAYQKIEDGVVGIYKKVEDGVVGTYEKVENAFVDRFLEKVEENDNEER